MTGLRTCPDCDGEGITECTACSNRKITTFVEWRSGSTINPFGCMVCANRHDVPCPTCNGTGYQGFSLRSETTKTETET